MTTQEFSNQFDILYNNINSEKAPGLNSYEKSVFLTKAQDEFILSIYNGRNIAGLSFESTEESRRYLNSLIKTTTVDAFTPSVSDTHIKKINPNNKLYKLPNDLCFIISEQIKYSDSNNSCIDGLYTNVYPVTADTYAKIKNNPFRGITKYKALRMDIGQVIVTEGTNVKYHDIVELASLYDIDEYIVRYLAESNPIIIDTLGQTGSEYEGLSIKGKTDQTECELPESVHEIILQNAVNLAKVAWQTTVH